MSSSECNEREREGAHIQQVFGGHIRGGRDLLPLAEHIAGAQLVAFAAARHSASDASLFLLVVKILHTAQLYCAEMS